VLAPLEDLKPTGAELGLGLGLGLRTCPVGGFKTYWD
jgi:hypothetical protein